MGVLHNDYTVTWPADWQSVPVGHQPHKCPICKGRCKVHKGFYQNKKHSGFEKCRACKGEGVLWR